MKIKEVLERFLNKLIKQPKKQLPQLNIDEYSQKVEAIDDIEIGRMFEKSVTQNVTQIIQKYSTNASMYEYPLETKISEHDTIELAKQFFVDIDSEISSKINDIIDGKNLNIILAMKPYDGTEGAHASNPNKTPIRVCVPIRGDIRQLYELIHELTHTLDIGNGDTTTRRILGEVAPQCMERLLDEYLLSMSDEEFKRYGFDKSILEQDIQDRRISTFISRYENVLAFNNRTGNREIDSRYMLAQVYSTHFNKFDTVRKKQKIKAFISHVQDDKFEKANASFDMKIDKNNKVQRDCYINDAINEVENINKVKTEIPDVSMKKILEKTIDESIQI